jgi:hypothetical protein
MTRDNASLLEMRSILAVALRVVSVPVGVVFGLWTVALRSPSFTCGGGPLRNSAYCGLEPNFAFWVCALFGAAAAALVVLVSIAVDRRIAK